MFVLDFVVAVVVVAAIADFVVYCQPATFELVVTFICCSFLSILLRQLLLLRFVFS